MARKLIVEIVGDASSLQKELSKAEKSSRGFSSVLGTVGKTAGLAAGAVGVGGLALVLKQGAQEFAESSKVAARTSAVIKSTGGAANVTAKHVDELANSILRKTGIDDEATKSAENLLLTFTNIRNEAGKGNDIFDQTTRVVTDMSVALKQDATASAKVLGRALNDPVGGLTRLQRVGVKFTKAQKDQIKALVDSGKTMQAQKIILGQLEQRFGGTAEAVGKTLPGQLNILREQFNNVAGDVVAKFVPALTGILKWVNAHWPEISKVFDHVADAIGIAIGKAVEVIRPIVAYIRQHWPEISATIKAVAADVRAVWDALWPTVSKVVVIAAHTIGPVLQNLARIIKGVVEVISGIMHGDWSKAWDGVQDIVAGVFRGLRALLGAQVKILGVIAGRIGAGIKNALVNALEGIGKLVANALIFPVNLAIDALNALKVTVGTPKVSAFGHTIIPAFSKTIDPIPGDIGHLALATGGIVSSPTFALIGEKGPEAVVPLNGRNFGGIQIHGDLVVAGVQNPNQLISGIQREAGRRAATRTGRFAGRAIGAT